MIRYYLGRPISVASTLEGWVWGYDSEGRDWIFWHDQLKATPWGLSWSLSESRTGIGDEQKR